MNNEYKVYIRDKDYIMFINEQPEGGFKWEFYDFLPNESGTFVQVHLSQMSSASEIDTLESQLKVATDAATLGLSFAPKGPVPPGLDPTFYHTLNYQSEVELQNKIDAAREALAKIRGEG